MTLDPDFARRQIDAGVDLEALGEWKRLAERSDSATQWFYELEGRRRQAASTYELGLSQLKELEKETDRWREASADLERAFDELTAEWEALGGEVSRPRRGK